jgi:hypothetical protein
VRKTTQKEIESKDVLNFLFLDFMAKLSGYVESRENKRIRKLRSEWKRGKMKKGKSPRTGLMQGKLST